ncbi:MAG: hypothetical protein RSG86_01655 [Oscillospiraceae bacterium]
MEAKNLYTAADCTETGYDCALQGKVIVLSRQVLPEDYQNQLFFCSGGKVANPNPIGQSVFLTSLSDGEQHRFFRSDVVGVLEPLLLPDSAKLHLSQIRPPNALPLEQNEPKYSGYSFLPDGRYASGVWLCSEQEVMDYIELQKPYQHRIMICDRNDFCVLEMQEGKLLYPNEEAMEAFRQKEQGGMTMT